MTADFLLETDRLIMRELNDGDAEFYLAMLSDPDFKTNIADRGVTTVEQALANMEERVFTSYEVHGFGMWLVIRKSDNASIGMAGLVKRDFLDDVDVGYAFLPVGRGEGFATEATAAVVDCARERFGITRLAAIVDGENAPSIRVLERLGFLHEGQVRFPDDGEIVQHYMLSEV